MSREYGETWVYESLVGGLPGLDLSTRAAVAIQLGLFQTGVLLLGWYYGLWDAVLAGTVAVLVATGGSVAMRRLGDGYRALDGTGVHTRLLFGSSIEIVLGILAFIGLVTVLFVGDTTLVTTLFGDDPPAPAVFLTLLILWDLCYRIGTAWWAAVVACWRGFAVSLPTASARQAIRLDAGNVAFGGLQLALVPFLTAEPLLLGAVLGHVLAVAVVSSTAAAATWRNRS